MISAPYVNKLRCVIIGLVLIATSCFADPKLNVEIAKTSAEKAWGLMGRHALPENQGMLFVYQPPEKMSFWMFNTLIDLSIAFIDRNNIVGEIHEMKAYPEKMDNNRPIKQLADIDQYTNNEQQFFREHSVISQSDYAYALEASAGWFTKHGVKVGDRMIFDEQRHRVSFQRKASS
ncbi:MAG: DUF192 domain-containing protein [Pseudomonadota bacterium]|nr:DUF192 domain-containing protein [Pseudomonadota bacterium]